MKIEVEIINETETVLSDWIPEAIQNAVHTVLALENLNLIGEVSVLLVDNNKITDLNKTYRNKNQPTDVLSFPQYDSIILNGVEDAYVYLGDIVISTEKAIEQAIAFEHSLEREIVYLAVHSTLHLLGYDHMVESDKKNMRDKEKQVMKQLKVFK